MQAKVLFANKQAAFNYDIVEKLEVGIVLYGWEVKSLKAGRANLTDSYIKFTPNAELLLVNAKISTWKTAPQLGLGQEERERRLLARKSEAARIGGLAARAGYTSVCLSAYLNDKGMIKLEIAVVKGRKKYQKKQKLKEKDLERELDSEIKNLNM